VADAAARVVAVAAVPVAAAAWAAQAAALHLAVALATICRRHCRGGLEQFQRGGRRCVVPFPLLCFVLFQLFHFLLFTDRSLFRLLRRDAFVQCLLPPPRAITISVCTGGCVLR
jgi:hypothetical protein